MVRMLRRSTWFGDRPPDMNDGTPRPLLAQPVPGLTVHYRGSPINDSATADPVAYMIAAEQRADWARKSFEYNYIILPRRPGGLVCEYAGLHRAAHSAGENHWIGVQFALGVNNHPQNPGYDRTRPTVWQQPDRDMFRAYRWLRDVHLAGVLSSTFEQRRHKDMPGAQTACPGEPIDAHWDDEILVPHEEEYMQTVNPTLWFNRTMRRGEPLIVPAPYGWRTMLVNVTVHSDGDGYVVGWDGVGDFPTGATCQLVPGRWANNLQQIAADVDGNYRFDLVGAPTARINVGIQAISET